MSDTQPPEDLAVELAKLWSALERWADVNLAPDVREKVQDAWTTLSEVAETMTSRPPRGDSD